MPSGRRCPNVLAISMSVQIQSAYHHAKLLSWLSSASFPCYHSWHCCLPLYIVSSYVAKVFKVFDALQNCSPTASSLDDDLFDLRALLGFERWQSANKELPLGSVKDHLGSIGGVEASRIEIVLD